MGLGIAGIAVCRELDRRNLSYIVYDSAKDNATSIAGGVVNPVVIKRINPAWRASEFLSEAAVFYKDLQEDLNGDFCKRNDVLRILSSVEEQNNWLVGSDTTKLRDLIDPTPITTNNEAIHAPFGFGLVKGCLQLDTGRLINSFNEYLLSTDRLISSSFSHKELSESNGRLYIGEISAKKLILTQGVGVLNHYFGKLDCLIPKKGEYLTFRSPGLKLKQILKGKYFIIPKGGNTYQTGATFVHGETSSAPTEKSKVQMVEALEKIIKVPYEIIDQAVGIRPTVKDRRPLAGRLEDDKDIYLLNGLGSRGLLMAPLLAQWLLNHAEDGQDLPSEVDVNRYLTQQI